MGADACCESVRGVAGHNKIGMGNHSHDAMEAVRVRRVIALLFVVRSCLFSCGVGVGVGVGVAVVVQELAVLEVLDVESCGLSSTAIRSLLRSFRDMCHLRCLVLRGNRLDGVGAEALARLLTYQTTSRSGTVEIPNDVRQMRMTTRAAGTSCTASCELEIACLAPLTVRM